MPILVCADDFALNEPISLGQLALIKAKVLSGVSCMTNRPLWSVLASELKRYTKAVKIGVHFNLEESACVGQIALCAFTGRLDKAAMVSAWQEQIDGFVSGIGRLPDFLDGHEHIHQFPTIREAMLEVYEARLRGTGAFIRVPAQPCLAQMIESRVSPVKQWVIASLGAWTLRRELIAREIPHNTRFAGIYDFASKARYADLFPKFLAMLQGEGILMCHPGFLSHDTTDPIRHRRFEEYQFLSCTLPMASL